MELESFDWTLVRSFLAVLDAGSLMGAARKLGAQQPTLSRHVAELERQLGAPLFERTGRGVTPTALALAIADGARQMQGGADALARSLAGTRDATSGTVRITTSQVAAGHLLPPLLAALHAGRARHPGRTGGLQRAEQSAAPRGRHRGAHGAAACRARWWRASWRDRRSALQRTPHYLARAGTPRQPAGPAAAPADRLRPRRHHRARLRGAGPGAAARSASRCAPTTR